MGSSIQEIAHDVPIVLAGKSSLTDEVEGEGREQKEIHLSVDALEVGNDLGRNLKGARTLLIGGFGADVGDVDLMRKMGRKDLSVFHYDARNKLRTLFNDNVLQIDKLLSETRSSWNGI